MASRIPKTPVYYHIFDILFLNGKNLMNRTYEQRRKALESLRIQHPFCKVPPSYRGDPEIVVELAKQFKLEGLLCKKIDSPYVPGRRTDNWIKVKYINSREFVIGGFKYGKSQHDRIRSLQLGAYDNKMVLHFVGAAGTGFSQQDHEILLKHLEAVKVKESTFQEKTDREVIFTKPIYIAQIEYRRWPKNGLIQQAAYKGLRTDKHPAEIKLKE